MISLFVDKLYKYFSCTRIINTKVGIKPINQIANSDWFNEIVIKSVTDLNLNQIISPPDFLKDKYTLIGLKIDKLSHYELMKYLDKNFSLKNCDYIKRRKKGTLDFLKKMNISTKLINETYQKKLRAMKDGKFFLVKVFNVYDDIYMVADGKHSLSMALYFNYPNLKFNVIHNPFFDTYFRWIFEKIKNNKDFTKHNNFFKKAVKYRKKLLKINLINSKINF